MPVIWLRSLTDPGRHMLARCMSLDKLALTERPHDLLPRALLKEQATGRTKTGISLKG